MATSDMEVRFVEEPEGEEPIEHLDPAELSQAVVYSTDWTTETILSQLKRSNILVDPKFQRRDAWSRSRKSRFIESLILGLPIPQIVLAERNDRKGQYIVLDGKQRLLTLLQFTGGAQGKNNAFTLASLEVRSDLNRRSFNDLREDLLLADDLNAFLNQTIRSVVIRNWPNPDFLHLVFVRLNTGSVSLSPQELREALFPGLFVDFADEYAAGSRALRHLLKLDEPDFRMRDVEILTRHLAFSFFLPSYTGNFKAFMDSTCDRLNRGWDRMEESVRSRVAQFEEAVEAGIKIFGPDHVGRKWTRDGFESRLNRAVLDVITFYFADAVIREAALVNAEAVVAAFKRLCESDEFRSSIEATTKSMTATVTRFAQWGSALGQVTGLSFTVPVLANGNISFGGLWS